MCFKKKYQDIYKFLIKSFRITNGIIYEEDCENKNICGVVHISQVMLHRLQEQINTAFMLLKKGHWASLEAILRVCIEYSIQIMYLCEKSTKDRLGQYFLNYFSEMEKRQSLMINAFSDKPDIQMELRESTHILKTKKQIIEGYCNHSGISFVLEDKISFLKMCEELGQEKLYRELYSKLSDVVHANADSLIDYILIYCIQHNKSERRIAEKEVQEWIMNYFLRIILLYNSAHLSFVTCFGLNSRKKDLEKLNTSFIEIYQKYLNNFTIIGKNA